MYMYTHYHIVYPCFRSQTQHQYKVNELAKEIRDLEADESGFEMGIPRTPEIGETSPADTPTHSEPQTSKKQKDDNGLFGLLQGEIVSAPARAPPPSENAKESDQSTPETLPKQPESSDNDEHQENSEFSAPPTTEQVDDELGNLLSLLDAPLESTSEGTMISQSSSEAKEGGVEGGTKNEWDMYIEQQHQHDNDDDDDDDGGWGDLVRHAQKSQDEKGQGDGWSNDILTGESSDQDIGELEKEIDRLLLGNEEVSKSLDNEEVNTTDTQEDTFDPLAQLSTDQAPPSNHQDSLDQLGLDPSLFQPQGSTPLVPPLLIPQVNNSLPLPIQPSPMTQPPSLASKGNPTTVGSGFSTVGSGFNTGRSGFSTVGSGFNTGGSGFNTVGSGFNTGGSGFSTGGSGSNTGTAMGRVGGATSMGVAQGRGGVKSGPTKEGDNKKKGNWMNVFAHLDPIANEKA